jgi:sterol desaturase/sphingolipid hydroxylase (fatty acid hydroxylase superfamily)
MIAHTLFYIFSYDIWFYISHVILHNRRLYATIHKIHHNTNTETMRYSDTYVAHYLESPFQSLGIFVPLIFIPPVFSEILLFLAIVNVRGMLRHDTRYIWLIGNHDILHHKYPRYNFGEYWLDWIFCKIYPNEIEYRRGSFMFEKNIINFIIYRYNYEII